MPQSRSRKERKRARARQGKQPAAMRPLSRTKPAVARAGRSFVGAHPPEAGRPVTVTSTYMDVGLWEGGLDLADPLATMGDDAAFAALLAEGPAEDRDRVLACMREDHFIWYMQGALCAEADPDRDPGGEEAFAACCAAIDEEGDVVSARVLVERFAERVAAAVKAREESANAA